MENGKITLFKIDDEQMLKEKKYVPKICHPQMEEWRKLKISVKMESLRNESVIVVYHSSLVTGPFDTVYVAEVAAVAAAPDVAS